MFPFALLPQRIKLPGFMPSPANLRIDWTHPMAAGLTTCCIATGPKTVIEMVRPRGVNCTQVSGGLRARGMGCADFSFAMTDTTEANFTTGGWSVAAMGYWNGDIPGHDFDLWRRYTFTDPTHNQGWGLEATTGGPFQFYIFNNNGNYALASTTNKAVGFWTLGGTTDGTTRRIYVRGVEEANSAVNPSAASCTSGTQGLGQLNDPPNSSATGWEFQIGCTWSRTLSAHEMRQFHYDPYCFLISDTPPALVFFDTSVTGTVGQSLFKATTALSGTVGPGGQINQTFFKITQSLAGGVSSPEDLFFSWRTD